MIAIAMTQRLVENELYAETRDALDVRWANFCRQLGVLPIILPTAYDFHAYFESIDIRGIILTGGNDLARFSRNHSSMLRDTFEKSLLQFALERVIPVFAVCRGMQLVADYFGAGIEQVVGHARSRHALVVGESSANGSFLDELTVVNSYHSYGFYEAPKGFDVIARASDGVIEAMQHCHHKIFCQMWHPEREQCIASGERNMLNILFNLPEGDA